MNSVAEIIPARRAVAMREVRIASWWRPVALIACVLVGYFFSLSDLLRSMKFETPLSYLGLVPPIAFILGCWCYRRAGAAPASVTVMDVAAGGALVCLAILLSLGLPVAIDAYTWSQRLDLLSLPIFVAGLLFLLYGHRALGWAWPALLYLFLIWPVPYTIALTRILNPLTQWMAVAVGGLLHLIPLGTTVDPSDRTIFTVATPFGDQQVSIGSMGASFNSFVGWFLIGVAACVVLRGRKGIGEFGSIARRIGWLVLGLILTIVINVVRVFLLFLVVHKDGFGTLFTWVHALLGLAFFAGIILLMLALTGRFGLTLSADGHTTAPTGSDNGPFPAQGSLVALGAFLLSLGVLLSPGIMQMLIAFVCVFLICMLFTLDFPRARTQSSANTAAPSVPLLRRVRPAVLAVWLLGTATVILGVATFSWFVGAHSPGFHALGRQIGAWEQGIVTGWGRIPLIALAAIGTLFVVGKIAQAPRYQPGADRPLRLTPLAGRRALVVIGGVMLLSTTLLALTNVTVASFS